MMNDEIDLAFWHPDVRDPAETAEGGPCHDPDRDEIRGLLLRYFQPPITEDLVDRVEADYRRVRASPAERRYHARYYRSTRDSTRWRGTTWYEELYRSGRAPGLSDLVLMRADVLSEAEPLFPPPRRFCPILCVGTWEPFESRGQHHDPFEHYFVLILQRGDSREDRWEMSSIKLRTATLAGELRQIPLRLRRVSRRCMDDRAPPAALAAALPA